MFRAGETSGLDWSSFFNSRKTVGADSASYNPSSVKKAQTV